MTVLNAQAFKEGQKPLSLHQHSGLDPAESTVSLSLDEILFEPRGVITRVQEEVAE